MSGRCTEMKRPYTWNFVLVKLINLASTKWSGESAGWVTPFPLDGNHASRWSVEYQLLAHGIVKAADLITKAYGRRSRAQPNS